MTRRLAASLLLALGARANGFIPLPVHVMTDSRAKLRTEERDRFRQVIWNEAYRDLGRVGIWLEGHESVGEMGRAPSGRPVFRGLQRGAINVVLTREIPMEWDRARRPAALATVYDGYHLILLAVPRSHGHQVPWLSVNTLVHELLHVLLGDILQPRPGGWSGEWRELRVDAAATRLWLLGQGSEITRLAARYRAP